MKGRTVGESREEWEEVKERGEEEGEETEGHDRLSSICMFLQQKYFSQEMFKACYISSFKSKHEYE